MTKKSRMSLSKFMKKKKSVYGEIYEKNRKYIWHYNSVNYLNSHHSIF